jgi:hypothetical protein
MDPVIPTNRQPEVSDEEFKKSVLMYLSFINNGITALIETVERSIGDEEQI